MIHYLLFHTILRYFTLFHTVIHRVNREAASAPPSHHCHYRAPPTFVGCARGTTANSLDWMLNASRRRHAVHLC